MPDNDFLTKIARRMMGVPYRTELSVDVTAPRPSPDDPYPPDMDRIMLGDETTPPTGAYVPTRNTPIQDVRKRIDALINGTQDPLLREAISRLGRRYPHAAAMVSNVELAPSLDPRDEKMLGAFAVARPDRSIGVSPRYAKISTENDMDETLAHELAHITQQYPSRWFLPYDQRPSEQNAFGVGSAADRRNRQSQWSR